MNNKKIDIDEIIREGLKLEADKINVPPKEEIWAEISKHLENKKITQRRQKRKFKLAVASIAVVLYFGATPWVFPRQDAEAVGERLVKIFQTVFGGETKVDTISRENNPPPSDQPPPPDEQVPVEKVGDQKPRAFKDVEEARETIPFSFHLPEYVPKGHELTEITYSDVDGDYGEVVLRYAAGNNKFTIIERKLPGDFATSSTVSSDRLLSVK